MKPLIALMVSFGVLVGTSGYTQAQEFISQRADPWVMKTPNHYYFTASLPEFDRIILRGSDTLAGLANAQEVVAWSAKPSGAMSANIWAPELHRINGSWFIYFAAGEKEQPFAIRSYVLRNDSDNPLTGDWQEQGKLQTPWDTFNLDVTVFAHNDTHYAVWAQHPPDVDYNSALYIAELLTPTTLGPATKISEPTYAWEKVGFAVNEGAAVIKRNGQLWLTYSASATDANYAMGLLSIDADADVLDAANWHKSEQPVLTTNADFKRFGPGHSSFTQDANGRDILVYHARSYKEIDGNPLHDPNRHTRLRVLYWDDNGRPDFAPAKPDLTLEQLPSAASAQ